MKAGIRAWILVLIPLFAFRAAAAAPAEPDEKIVYKTIGGTTLSLHVFKPADWRPVDRRPAIVFFFGGGWTQGSPRQFYQQARYCAGLGVVAFSAEYRVGLTPFECVKDGKSAVRWIRRHAGELGIDPGKIVAAGGSAGGHVAACAGVIQGYEEEGEATDVSSVPDAMILFNPVIDTTEKGYGMEKVGAGRKTEISPCAHVRKGICPALIFHGTDDAVVPFENVKRFAGLMTEAGNQCRLVPFAGRGHGFFNSREFRPALKAEDYEATMRETRSFLVSLDFLPETEIRRNREPGAGEGKKPLE